MFPAAEYHTLQTSLKDMIDELDDACFRSSDPPQGDPILVSSRTRVERQGRPRVEIDQNFLRFALEHRGPTFLAELFQCSSRSVRRRAIDYGLVTPGLPVYTSVSHENGATTSIHTSSSRPVSTMSDEELDAHIGEILEIFPTFGRRMIAGHLQAAGYNVPRGRIQASYSRVHGPSGRFGQRQIARKTYKVAGPNSLWHHDGQHGMLVAE